MPDEIGEEIEKAKLELNLESLDYEATMKTKLNIAKKIFEINKNETFKVKYKMC